VPPRDASIRDVRDDFVAIVVGVDAPQLGTRKDADGGVGAIIAQVDFMATDLEGVTAERLRDLLCAVDGLGRSGSRGCVSR
jgi:hypothetical protein